MRTSEELARSFLAGWPASENQIETLALLIQDAADARVGAVAEAVARERTAIIYICDMRARGWRGDSAISAAVAVAHAHEADSIAAAIRARGAKAMVMGDVSKVTAALVHEALAALRYDVPIDIVFGGPPCQGMSTAGKQNPADPRNNLVLEFWRLADELGADVVVMENVPPLISDKKFRPLFDAIVERANAAGFTIVANILDACNYGVPQFRRRAFVVGTRGEATNQPFAFPMPGHWPIISAPGKEPIRQRFSCEARDLECEDDEDTGPAQGSLPGLG